MGKPQSPDTVRARRAAQTRAAIVAKARDLFMAFGYEDVTMRTIAKGCGISTGAIFQHFEGKDDLFTAAMFRKPINDTTGVRYLGALFEIRRCLNALTPVRWEETVQEVRAVLDRMGLDDPNV